jgi:hypothetical protein
MLGRALLALAGVTLVGTAILHGLGGQMVSGWLAGERRVVLELLWYAAGLPWAVVGVAWLLIAWRGDRRVQVLVWLLALIPGGAAAMIAYGLGPTFVPMWLLAGAALLAVLGSIALPRVTARPGAPSP